MALAGATAGLVAAIQPASAATSFPGDPLLAGGDQWALTGTVASINAPSAWCVSTGAGITVAVVDTGADFSHPDLAGKLIPGAQFLGGIPYGGGPSAGPNNVAAVSDGHFHGTFVSGIIGADTGNGQGMAAVAPDARILVVKVLDDSGGGYDSDVANGIRWAADNGAQVINVSIGSDLGVSLSLTGSSIPRAVAYAHSRGASVALAAGNSSLPAAAYQGLGGIALVVGATGPDGRRAAYSDGGIGVDIYAPGGDGNTTTDQTAQLHENIVSTTLHGGYATGAGTSFAAPQVAGTLALLRARGLSADQARDRILGTAVNRGGLSELDAAAAVGASGTCGSATAASVPPPRVRAPLPPRPSKPAPRPVTPAPTPIATAPATAPPSPSPAPSAAPSAVIEATPSAASTPAPRTAVASAPSPPAGRGHQTLVEIALGGAGAIGLGAAALIPWRRRRRLPG